MPRPGKTKTSLSKCILVYSPTAVREADFLVNLGCDRCMKVARGSKAAKDSRKMSIELQSRPLPPETVTGLRPPQAGFPYFAHADRLRFQPDATEHSVINSWWLADASFLVYGDAAFIEDAIAISPLPTLGFDKPDWLGTRDDNRGMILANDEALVIVFRGTRLQAHTILDVAELVLINQQDLWTDTNLLPAVFTAGGRVHAGFLSAFKDVSDRLDALVRTKAPRQRLWLTGHSLGGALATLAAAHLGSSVVQGLSTYGCPRVGDTAFTSVLPRRSYDRFVHRDDWVATVPPEILGYAHAGTLRVVPGSPPRSFWRDLVTGAESLTAAVKAMAADLRLDVGQLPFSVAGLADHAPVYYATLLWNALLA